MISFRLKQFVEHSLLTMDVARGVRSSVAFTSVWAVCLWTGHPKIAVFAATAAQNLTLVDLRGDYRARLGILLTMTVVIAAAVFAGRLAGNNVVSATLMVGALGLLGSVWRHLSADYGPNLAIVSTLLFLFALAQPGDWQAGTQAAEWVSLGCAVGIIIQLCGWLMRPQHPVRHAVAESWVAVSDLVGAMRPETSDSGGQTAALAVKENELRTTLDRTFKTIETATTKRRLVFFKHLDDATQIAGRFGTRVSALHTAMEPIRARPDFTGVAPALDLLLQALGNAARSAALTIILHRPEQQIALDVRLRRCNHLGQILAARLDAWGATDADVAAALQMLAQVDAVLPVVRATIQETVDHGAAHATLALRLPELSGFSLRHLSAWLNPAPQLDAILLRYAWRIALVLMVAVAIYEWFEIPRGYWIAFTAMIVLQPDYGSTRQKAGQRLAGTFAGCVMASVLLWLKLPVTVLMLLTAASSFCFAYFLKSRYGVAICFVTVMLVLITDAVEPVDWDFTVFRVVSTLAGGGMALLAALFLWPRSEQEQFPKILAAGLRANRNYLTIVISALRRGEPFAGPVIQKKREAERANSQVAASLQRMLGEPSSLQDAMERAAALTAYNQRLTRAITVLAVHLNQRTAFPEPDFIALGESVGAALELLAQNIEAGETPASPMKFSVAPARPMEGSPSALLHGQLARIITEIEAMELAREPLK